MLNEFIKKYKSSDVIPHAQNLVNYLEETDTTKSKSNKNTNTSAAQYIYDQKMAHYFVLPVPTQDAQTLKTGFSNYNTEFHGLEELSITSIIFNSIYQFLIVKEFSSGDAAMNYLNEVKKDENFKKKVSINADDAFVINIMNMSLLMNSKDISKYREFFKQNYK